MIAPHRGNRKQAGHARSAKVKPLHATLARRALLRLDSMAAPDPHSLGVPRPQFPRLCPACLPRYSLQTILRRVLVRSDNFPPARREFALDLKMNLDGTTFAFRRCRPRSTLLPMPARPAAHTRATVFMSS